MSPYHAMKKRQGLKMGQSRNAVCLAMLGRLDKPLKMECSLEPLQPERDVLTRRAVG
jgi:hypothetical protein